MRISDWSSDVCSSDLADADARAIFAKKKNLRLLLTGELPDPARGGLMMKAIAGGWLAQSRDNGRITPADLKVVTERAPTDEELTDALFAWPIAKHVKSNANVYAKGGSTAGTGAGQMHPRDRTRTPPRSEDRRVGQKGLS